MKIGGLLKTSLIDYPNELACIVFTKGCNFRCPYCHNPELVDSKNKEKSLSIDKIMKFLKSRRGKLSGVSISGGEPTIHSDLTSFLEEIKKMGFKIKLDTNGSNPSVLSNIIRNHLVDYLAMDVKAPLNKYSYVTRTSINLVNIVKSINLIKESGLDYEFRTTVVKSLLDEEDILDITNLIEGAKIYYLQQFIPEKTLEPEFREEKSYTAAELGKIAEKITNVKTLVR